MTSTYDSGSLGFHTGVSLTAGTAQDFGVGTDAFDLTTAIGSGVLDFTSTTPAGFTLDTSTAWADAVAIDAGAFTVPAGTTADLADPLSGDIDLGQISLTDDTATHDLSASLGDGTVDLADLDLGIATGTTVPTFGASSPDGADAFSGEIGAVGISDADLGDLSVVPAGDLPGDAADVFASLDAGALPQEVQDLIAGGLLETGGAGTKINEPGGLPSWSLDSYLKARVLANQGEPPIGLETLILFDPRPGYVNFGNGSQVSIPDLIVGMKNVGLLRYVGPEVVVTQPGLVAQLNTNPDTGEPYNPELYDQFESAAAEIRGFFPSGGITVLGLDGYHRF